MNTSFERVKNSTDEWYTPKYIIDALGEFDTDPCSPMMPPFKTANTMYNKVDRLGAALYCSLSVRKTTCH